VTNTTHTGEEGIKTFTDACNATFTPGVACVPTLRFSMPAGGRHLRLG
jgi:hypothetical protein